MIRDAELEDFPTLKAVHEASGFDYVFPDLKDPLFVIKKTDGYNGIAVKLEGTVYLWLNHLRGTPEERWTVMQELVEEAKLAAWEKGLDTLTCVIPPELEKSFDKRLRDIGMDRDRPWSKYSFDLTSYVPSEKCDILPANRGAVTTGVSAPCASSKTPHSR